MTPRLAPLALVLLLAACGSGDPNSAAANQAGAEAEPSGAPVEALDPEEAAALANEAAADEAADMDAYGGNAAAGADNGAR
jgi:hypothetical protein